jgi:hypothetical protein
VSLLVILTLLGQSGPNPRGWIWREPTRWGAWSQEAAPTSGFGGRILPLGDVNEDGVPDLAIGAPLDPVVGADPGRLFVVCGRTGTLLWHRPLQMEIERPQYLPRVDGLDLDGDGLGERFAPTENDGPVVAWSSRTGERLFVMHHDAPGGYVEDFGASVAPAGDLDRDGLVDVAIGCSEFGFDRGDAYAAELFSGRDGRRLLSIDTGGKSVSVATAADFNGDGCLDLPIGLPEDEVVFVMDGSALRRRMGSPRRIPIEGSVLLTLRRGSYPSGSPSDPFPELPSRSCDR